MATEQDANDYTDRAHQCVTHSHDPGRHVDVCGKTDPDPDSGGCGERPPAPKDEADQEASGYENRFEEASAYENVTDQSRDYAASGTGSRRRSGEG